MIVIAAIALPVALLAAAIALDFSSALVLKSRLQAATDSTVLTLATELSKTPGQLHVAGDSFLHAQDVGVQANLTGDPTVSANKTVCIQASARDKSAFAQLTYVQMIPITTSACAQSSGSNVEIAMVLDNSASMDNSAGGEPKILALRNAATAFVNSVFASTPGAKISIVPFQDAVALSSTDTQNGTVKWIDVNGQSSWHWKNWYAPNDPRSGLAAGVVVKSRFDIYNWLVAAGGQNYAWRGCFETLPYPLSVQDATPNITVPDSLYVPAFAPDEPDGYDNSDVNLNTYINDDPPSCPRPTPAGFSLDLATQQERICKYQKPKFDQKGANNYWNGPNDACNSQPMLRLGSSQAAILSKISQLVALGNTDLNEGFMWGWRSMSPNGPLQDGAPYGPSVSKAIILMTDGMNFYPVADPSMNGGIINPMGSGYDALGYLNNITGRLPVQANGSDYQLVTSQGNQQQSPALDELTREACANGRAAGIQVYTIGFEASDIISADGQQLLKDCAGGDPTHFFLVTDEPSLAKAFSDIRLGVSAPRLVK